MVPSVRQVIVNVRFPWETVLSFLVFHLVLSVDLNIFATTAIFVVFENYGVTIRVAGIGINTKRSNDDVAGC